MHRFNLSGKKSTRDLIRILYSIIEIEFPEVRFAPAYPSYIYESEMNKLDGITTSKDNPTFTFQPTITHKIILEQPAKIGGDKTPFNGRSNFIPRIVDKVQSTIEDQDSGYYIKEMQYETYLKFEFFCISAYEVEKLYEEFRAKMYAYRDILKYLGIEEFFFHISDYDNNPGGMYNRLNRRNQVYYVKTMELYKTENIKKLEHIKIKLGIKPNE